MATTRKQQEPMRWHETLTVLSGVVMTYTQLVYHVHMCHEFLAWFVHCRVYLDHLKSPGDAVRVVKESQSTEGAKMVAKYVCIVVSH